MEGHGRRPEVRPAMQSECDRVARLVGGCRLLVFGFWTGALPEVSRLHFISAARALPPDSRYILFTSDAIIPRPMQDLLEACGIAVVPLDFPRLMGEVGASRLLRQTPLSPCWPWVLRLARRPGWASRLPWFCHSRMDRVTPHANFLLGGPPLHRTLMSDYVRVVISSIVPAYTLYTDIDVAFPRNLDWIFRFGSFVYRWETRRYANSALISVTEDSPIKRGKLLTLLNRDGTAKPWVLLSEENCRACGLDILSCDRLDPNWSRATLDGAKCGDLFTRSERSAAELSFLKHQFDAVHWHNKWNRVPEAGSVYDLWLRELEPGGSSRAAPPVDA